MKDTFDLRIADLSLRMDSTFPLSLPEYFRPFQTEAFPAEPEIAIHVEAGDLCGQERNCDVQSFYWDHGKSIYRLARKNAPGQITLLIPPEFQKRFARNANWLLYLALERPLLHYGRMILHASAVVYRGSAYVFAAPSGGGKSTQARIWEQERHAEVLNGDKVILRSDGKRLIAYGSPIAGSSGIYKDLCAPVAVIVQLEKGNENEISPLTMRDRYLLLYSEAVKSDWDSAFNRRLLQLAESYLPQAEYVRLRCLPEPSAAEALLRYLKQKRNETRNVEK